MSQQKSRILAGRRLLSLVIACSLAASTFALRSVAYAQSQKSEITVSAAASLKDVLTEIASAFNAEQPGATVHFNLGASGTLQQQIEQGAPVDVFISASPTQMDALAAKGLLVTNTRSDLVRNALVLVVPAAGSSVGSFQDLSSAQVKVIAIGEPQTVPAGKYAQEVLTHYGQYDSLKPKFVLGKDVRQVLTYVASGNADAGLVYATDARTTPEVKVAAIAPDDSHSPIVYPVAVVKDSKSPDAAKAFVGFLLSAKAQALFKKYGFSPTR